MVSLIQKYSLRFNFNFLKEASGCSSEDSLYMKTKASLVVALSQVRWNPLKQEICLALFHCWLDTAI